ncbi:LPXTG cell wall anchor domain-containing protein [Carnobacterium maltaromaticum]|uniref:LPXTG cell wall anchor domain-containing protein n=1 Tax=Carnobacterium maltaromaticum TaxID=2751 RepID=UPI00191BA953|nr:LPXTG cell wall anchor domain-containing protein [Carnobacterium maltaromaticum]CAD5903062.1 hypothetical protein CMALT394_620002 [Carnobacterium maltaromaticum]
MPNGYTVKSRGYNLVNLLNQVVDTTSSLNKPSKNSSEEKKNLLFPKTGESKGSLFILLGISEWIVLSYVLVKKKNWFYNY